MEISDHDWRHYRHMREAITRFEAGKLSLHNLMADLEGPMNDLRGADADWLRTFRTKWDDLELAYSAALVNKHPIPTSAAQSIKPLVLSIKALFDALPLHKYPCPCCGHVVFDDPPGSDEICPVCFWQDDYVQLRFPERQGGANRPSLVDAQKNFAASGCIEDRLKPYVRAPIPDEPRDPRWRPIDPLRDLREPTESEETQVGQETELYYWWRAP